LGFGATFAGGLLGGRIPVLSIRTPEANCGAASANMAITMRTGVASRGRSPG
jgi:hypothetical protein